MGIRGRDLFRVGRSDFRGRSDDVPIEQHGELTSKMHCALDQLAVRSATRGNRADPREWDIAIEDDVEPFVEQKMAFFVHVDFSTRETPSPRELGQQKQCRKEGQNRHIHQIGLFCVQNLVSSTPQIGTFSYRRIRFCSGNSQELST